jgi:hypothetical protein
MFTTFKISKKYENTELEANPAFQIKLYSLRRELDDAATVQFYILQNPP